jgi:hypothetical protein
METEKPSCPDSRQIPALAGKPSESQYRRNELRGSDDYRAITREAFELMISWGERLEALCFSSTHAPFYNRDKVVDLVMRILATGLRRYDPVDEQKWDETIFGWTLEECKDRSWREIWEYGESGEDIPLVETVGLLTGYAYYGIIPYPLEESTSSGSIETIRNSIQATRAALAPNGGGNPTTPTMDRVLLAAECRLKLDEDIDVTSEQLAALARIEIKSMRNALTPSSGSGLKVRDGAITAESALNWLRSRGNFKTSLWHEVEQDDPVAEPIVGEILWVPFADDKIEFHPTKSQREGNYTVGPKGSELTFSDYRAALDCLARMRPESYWWHPSTARHPRMVTAVGFHPRTAEELGLPPIDGGDR